MATKYIPPAVNADCYIEPSKAMEGGVIIDMYHLKLYDGLVTKKGGDGYTNIVATLHSAQAARKYGRPLGFSVAM